MKNYITLLLALIAIHVCAYAQKKELTITKTFHIASAGGWDYLAVNDSKLYVSHGTQVNIVDKETGDSLGVIEHTTGVHGIAFVKSLGKGFISNGKLNNVTVFDLQTDKPTGEIATGQNPDAILYDGFSKRVYTCNGRSNDVTVIDPATEKVVATIAVGGRPETAVSNEEGKLFVNIEDKNEIVAIDLAAGKVENRWSIAPGESPTGLAYDKGTKRLFSACDNKLLMVVNAATGKIVTKLPIGDGCDGDAFDPATKNIYTSNGDGTLTVIHEKSANNFVVTANVTTKPRARTIALDTATHCIYLPTAEFEKPSPDAPKNERPKMIPGTFQVLVLSR